MAVEANIQITDSIKNAVLAAQFPCVFGQAAMRAGSVRIFESDLNGSSVCETVYANLDWVQEGVEAEKLDLRSFMVVFPEVAIASYDEFMESFINLMVSMRRYDLALGHGLLPGLSDDPRSERFSFPIGGQAWFLPIGYSEHPSWHRRIGEHAFMIINNHLMFDKLKSIHGHSGKSVYEMGKAKIHERLGEVHKLLQDHGADLEWPQYLLPPPEYEDRMWEMLDEKGGLKNVGI